MPESANNHMTPVSLKTNGCVDPLGIDTPRPLFRWQLRAQGKNSYQKAYRITVTDDRDKMVWDSGKVCTSRQLQIPYEGESLLSMIRYRWRVMVWDQNDAASEWSNDASFEMGLLQASDWKAHWIGGNSILDPLGGLNWIGVSGEEKVTIQKTFFLSKEAQQIVLDAAAYESWELFCNGRLRRRMNTEWKRDFTTPIRYADLTEFFGPGINTIKFCVSSGKYGAVLAARIQIRYADGTEEQLVTDESWQTVCREHIQSACIVGTLGDDPWGKLKRRGPAPLLRKEFEVAGVVERARLYVCGLGYEDCHINGMPVSDGVLRGEYTQFHKTVYYNTMDVTALLQQGRNCLAAELGRGYYAFGKDWIGVMAEQDEPKLLAQLEIWYTDGTRQTVRSDLTWQTTDGPTADDNIWYGEKYDARLEPVGWKQPGFDDTMWLPACLMQKPEGTLRANFLQPIRVKEMLQPVCVKSLGPRKYLYDFGRVTTGWATIRVEEPRGSRIRLRYGENLLESGAVDMQTKCRVFQFWEPAQEDIYICRGSEEEIWTPKFSYKGYRYVEIEGLDHEVSVTGLVLHNDLAQTGSFHCSNELFNQIHEIIIPTILNNFHSIPTDTPTYEKRGWTGDAQSICDTVLVNLDAQLFFRKWLQDLADSQNVDGAIPDTCPGPVYYPPAPEWMCAMVIVPYQLYLHCGDEEVLHRYYPEMKRYMEYEINRLQNGLSSNLHYGDWNSPAGSCPPEGSTFNSTCFVYYVCSIMQKIADHLGKNEDSAHFLEAAEQIRNTLNNHFFDENTMLYHTEKACGFRQTPTLLPLAFGIVPEEKRDTVAASLAENIRQKDDCHLTTGCMGLKFLAPTLTRLGYGDVANAIVDRKDFPSWGYWISKGATTCWETWDTDSRSYNHFYFGTIDDWFYQCLAGIQPTSAGYKTFTIQPYCCGSLTETEASVNTPYGRLWVHWQIADGAFAINIEVPVNTTAQIVMPGGAIHHIGSGKWHYEELI